MSAARVWAGGRIRALAWPAFTDARGSLFPFDFAALDFPVRRAFLVTAPPGAQRGGHAHRRTRQILLVTAGEVLLDFDTGRESGRITLGPSCPSVLIEPLVWARQTYCGACPAMLVFCDQDYDTGDYIHDRAGLSGQAGRAG